MADLNGEFSRSFENLQKCPMEPAPETLLAYHNLRSYTLSELVGRKVSEDDPIFLEVFKTIPVQYSYDSRVALIELNKIINAARWENSGMQYRSLNNNLYHSLRELRNQVGAEQYSENDLRDQFHALRLLLMVNVLKLRGQDVLANELVELVATTPTEFSVEATAQLVAAGAFFSEVHYV